MSTALLTPRKQRERRRIFWAVIASIVIHLLLILSIATVLVLKYVPPAPPPDDTPMEITLLPTQPAPPEDPTYLETNDSQRAAQPPEKPIFESNNDTQAASEQKASGAAPLPTQEGEQSPSIEFQNQQYTAGRQAQPSVTTPPPQQQQPTPPPVVAIPQPTPRAVTPLTLLEPPKPEPTPPQQPAATPSPATPPQPPAVSGYQPQTRVTRIRGNISNRGRASVAAAATPLGRYKKMLSDAIGSRWYYYVNDQLGMLNMGTLEVIFIVKEDGKVEGIRIISNSSNESFAACSVRAIMEAEIPPIPKEIVPMLEKGRIEIEYSFTIL